mgnify:CR=1 FL=1
MKKLIIKTIIITIVSIIAATLLAYCTLALLMPGRLAKAYDNLGFEKSAVKLMARKYDRSEDLSDLITLCTYAEKTGDNRLIAQHFAKLFEDEEFKANVRVDSITTGRPLNTQNATEIIAQTSPI